MVILPTVAAGADAAGRPTRRRYLITAMLFVTVVINYLDRSNLSITAPRIADSLHLGPASLGWIFSAFAWTYSFAQIPTGRIVDRFSPRTIYAVCIALWSVATICVGLSTGLASLMLLRMAVGLCEAPSYPLNSRIATMWFGERERATCIAIYTSAQFVGLAFLVPVLGWLLATFDWRAVFVATGLLGLAWAAIWRLTYRDPKHFPGVNRAEIDLIAAGGGMPYLSERPPKREGPGLVGRDLRAVLTRRKLWGIYLGQFGLGATNVFFLTWFPTYLVKYKKMEFIKAGFAATAPFLAAFLGVLCSGVLSDWLIRRGVALGTARKIPIVGGLLLTSVMIGASFTDDPTLVVTFLTISYFASGLASITWSLVSSIAPARLLGLTGGVFNFIGAFAFVVVPIAIGYLVEDGSSFAPALTLVVALSLMGALSYIFLVGKVERLPD